MNYIIKALESEKELKEKAYVHYTSWNETYNGLITKEYLNKISLEKCEKTAHNYQINTFIAVCAKGVVGFACYLPTSRDFVSIQPSSEIVALYVLKDYQREGIGTALLNKCLEILPERKVVLYILKKKSECDRILQTERILFYWKRN